MDDPPPKVHSFVVKVWAKEVQDPNTDITWRGSVTHVDSGERRYLESLMEVPGLLAPYIIDLGGTLDAFTLLFIWLAKSQDPSNRSAQ